MNSSECGVTANIDWFCKVISQRLVAILYFEIKLNSSECGVTANILVLGTSDSGFESRHSDKNMNKNNFDFFIDVRTKEEFDLEHSEESVNIPLDELEEKFDNTELAKINKNKKILLVCRSGSRAEMAKTFLKEKGFLNVENGGEWDNCK